MMATLTLNSQAVEFAPGETILQVARRQGVSIPALCHREGCRPETSCMVCVVRVEGVRRLVPACATLAAAGMVIDSASAEVQAARRTALELLLGDHLGDCVGPCHSLCPAHLDIPAMLAAVAGGEWEQAVAVVREAIPLPAVLGRICNAPCEKGCRRGDLDQAVGIKLIKGAVGDYALRGGLVSPPPTAGRGPRVAVVGAGPAGLTAAYYLTRQSYRCTIFDDQLRPGGALRRGPSENMLPRSVLEAEVTALLATGIELRPGQRVGREVSLAQLRADYQAVIIACGELTPEQAAELGLPWDRHGLQADRHSHETPLAGVYAAGAAVTPTRQAVRSVGSGHGVALAVVRALAGQPPAGRERPFSVHMGRLAEEDLAAFAQGADPAQRTPEPLSEGAVYAPPEAQAEARRCLHCECAGREQCLLREWSAACGANPAAWRDGRRPYCRETSHPGLIYEPGKCITCGLCVQIAETYREPLGLTFVGRGFEVRVGTPWDEPLIQALTEAAQACAEACPTRALVWRG